MTQCKGKKPAVVTDELTPASKNNQPAVKNAEVVVKPDWWAQQFDDMKGGLLPQVRSFLCIQTDIAIPGAIFQLGLNLQLSLDTSALCWGAEVELSVGVFFGFKIGPISLGVNIHFAGTLAVVETPADGPQIPETNALDALNATQTSDEEKEQKCTTYKNPFKILTEVIRKLKSGATRDEKVLEKINEAKKKIVDSDEYKGYMDLKTFQVPTKGPNNMVMVKDKLKGAFGAFVKQWPSIEIHIRKYVAAPLNRLLVLHII